MQPPATVSKVPEASESRPQPLEKTQVCKSTPWPGAGRKSGNFFEDRNWLLPPNYLNNDRKNAVRPKSSIKEEAKIGEQPTNLNVEKCRWGPNCPFCKKQEEGRLGWQTPKPNSEGSTPARSTKTPCKMSSVPKLSKAPSCTEIYPRGTT